MAHPQVRIDSGDIEGLSDGKVNSLLGIPYAWSPTKELRWLDPIPMAPRTGVREAKTFGPRCPQFTEPYFRFQDTCENEDWLKLNVWTSRTWQRTPVIVFIHGGSYLAGATVVTFNDRLCPFGFAVYPGVGTASFGLLDQQAALHWVRRNIANFGGDRDNVILVGSSAGAVSVRWLMSMPMAAGLFHRAIMQSAGFEQLINMPFLSYAEAQKITERLFDRLGTRNVVKLRLIPAYVLVAAWRTLFEALSMETAVHSPVSHWASVIDGFTIHSISIEHWPQDLPIMIGHTRNEAPRLTGLPLEVTSGIIEALTNKVCGSAAQQIIEDFCDANWLKPGDCLEQMLTAALFVKPCLATLRKTLELGRRNIYSYESRRVAPAATRTRELAEHASELCYVFGNLNIREIGYYDESDVKISEGMQHAWLTIARSGLPQLMDGSAWPEFDAEGLSTMRFGNAVKRAGFPTS